MSNSPTKVTTLICLIKIPSLQNFQKLAAKVTVFNKMILLKVSSHVFNRNKKRAATATLQKT